jgi:hypothetical protein
MATTTNTGVSSGFQSAETVKNKASEAASSLADKAKQAASDAGKKAEDAMHGVGSGMKSLADTIREKGPREGVAGTATSTLASGLESGAQYLQQEGFQGIADDLTNLVRRNPIPALMVGIGLGFILARATSRR